jgi:anti-anti-sigma factor
MDFEVGIVPLDGEVVVALRGDLDARASDVLDDVVRPMTGRYDAEQMTFDCTGVAAITAEGIDALVRIGKIPRGSGRMRVWDPSGRIGTVFADRPETGELFELIDDDLQSAAGS